MEVPVKKYTDGFSLLIKTSSFTNLDGFKTFGDFWDESYDQEWNHKTRLEMIFDLMLEINDWSIEKCQQKYKEMLQITSFNYSWLKDMDIQDYEMRSTL